MVINVPMGTSADFLNAVFARVYKIKRKALESEEASDATKDSDMADIDSATAEKEAEEYVEVEEGEESDMMDRYNG